MMLVMLTPSLTCAMPLCGEESATKAVAAPCAGHADDPTDDHGNRKSGAGQKLKLLKDCMGVDLQVVDSLLIEKTDIHSPVFIFALGDDPAVRRPDRKADAIRGPPPDRSTAHSAQPSLILSTQRFRI